MSMDLEREVEDRSAAHQSRNSYLRGSLPRPRLFSSGPSTVGQTPERPRRQPSADEVLITDDGGKVQRIKNLFRRRTTSATSCVESDCVRPTKPKSPPARVTGNDSVPLNNPTRAGALKKKPKSNIPLPTSKRGSTSRENENITKHPQKAGESNVINKLSGAPLHQAASSVLNVAQSGVATIYATQPSPYLSISTLDDLSSWDMDSLPSIPSPPNSPAQPTTLVAPAAPPNPFSDPIDDDASLENEIPFPFNRPAKVVREDMGIKKSKNKALRNHSANVLNRHVVATTIDTPPTNPYPSGLAGLPDPLPLRTLCQNTTAPHPLLRSSSSTPPKATVTPPKPNTPPGPSSSRKDAFGCFHLGALDCELSIAFPQTSHFEVWDMTDDSHIALPAVLCLMAKDPHAWSGTPLSLPDVTFIDIRCDAVPLPSRMSVYDPAQQYSTRYIGNPQAKPSSSRTTPHASPFASSRALFDREDISLDGLWTRVYSRPNIVGGAQIVRPVNTVTHASGSMVGAAQWYARGWHLKIWIPVPMYLFAKRETRVFSIDARIWMMGDEERVLSLDGNDGQVRPLTASAKMTLSHLRTPREMDGDWWR
ncbi:hypothetical protein BDN70DRAFT_199177 [Pholiota conissans]|uniref:Uncharacterized protein n=1 Tax=Pholiota conissans TaxID=109636 RepID=A0A9P6CXV9_9AGAR|nr:hypothetical protein BDN70DRAFT_199177 [Pholiota conissans]